MNTMNTMNQTSSPMREVENDHNQEVDLVQEITRKKNTQLSKDELESDAQLVFEIMVGRGFTFKDMLSEFFSGPNSSEWNIVSNGGGNTDFDEDILELFDDNWDLRNALILVLGREANTEEKIDLLINALFDSTRYIHEGIEDCAEIKCFDWTSVEPMHYLELLEKRWGAFQGTKRKEDFIAANEDAWGAFSVLGATGVDFSALEDEEDRAVAEFEPEISNFKDRTERDAHNNDRTKTLSQVAMHIRLADVLEW
jgi:hypothetical protein